MNKIFTRLPVKSLLRCKSVSKYWLSLVSDPEFVKDYHKSYPIENPNEFDCVVANKNKVGLVIISRNEEICILPPDHYEVFGSIHGLICLGNDHSAFNNNDKKFWLWNPAIHQFKEFNFPPGIRGSHTSRDVVGFGFDPVSNDYKVVFCRVFLNNRFVCPSKFDKRSAFVYSSNSDKWSDLIIPDNVFPAASEVQIPYFSNTIVKDCPYWISFPNRWPEEPFVPLVLVKFDTTSNVFNLFPEFHCKHGQNVVLVNMMDRPTLMEYEQHSYNLSVNVYSLDEEGSGVWSKIYTVDRPTDNFRRFRNLLQGFKCGGEILFEEYGRFSYYDHKTDKISHIPGTSCSSVSCCFGYTPSLVFLEGMESDMKSNTHLSQLVSYLIRT
ncbi:F-box/kelch-repeat protein At3g23880-like [Apium graveolens]|uniref:F-box/kelch-repeat protein At3g23880-like n=1 Tax=Apium graveolens TaxID=4045 RepID=UPI003D7B6047